MTVRHRYFSRNSIILLGIFFIIALFVRIQFVRLTIDHIYIARDAKQYVQYAHNLVEHGIFSRATSSIHLKPDSYRSPGYPLFIASAMAVGGERYYLAILIFSQTILSALLVPLTFFTGIFFLPAYGALIAALLVALSPHLITITGCVLTESLFAFFLLGAICCFQYALAKKYTVLFITSAILFGCAYLTNETSLFIPYLLLLILVGSKLTGPNKRVPNGMLLKMAVFLLIFSVVPIIWSVRNHLNVPSDAEKGSDRAIVTMSHGAYPDFIYKSPRYKRFPYREDPMQPEFGGSLENFRHILWERVKKEPLRYMKWYLVGKPYYLWSWDIIQGVGDIYINPVKNSFFEISKIAGLSKTTMRFFHPFVMLLAFGGIPFFCYNYWVQKSGDTLHNTALLPFAVCVYFTAIYMVFAPWPRYSVPLRPELYLCAVWSGTALTKFLLSRWRTRDSK